MPRQKSPTSNSRTINTRASTIHNPGSLRHGDILLQITARLSSVQSSRDQKAFETHLFRLHRPQRALTRPEVETNLLAPAFAFQVLRVLNSHTTVREKCATSSSRPGLLPNRSRLSQFTRTTNRVCLRPLFVLPAACGLQLLKQALGKHSCSRQRLCVRSGKVPTLGDHGFSEPLGHSYPNLRGPSNLQPKTDSYAFRSLVSNRRPRRINTARSPE